MSSTSQKKIVTKESAETLAADIDIQKLVLIMQETANVTGRKSLHTNTKSQKVVTKKGFKMKSNSIYRKIIELKIMMLADQ